MAEHKIPSALKITKIGERITVQVFRRTKDDSGTLESGSLNKYVGVLEAYSHNDRELNVKLVGLPMIFTSRTKHFVEIITEG